MDLSGIRAIGLTMDDYFSEMYAELDTESFSGISRNRHDARSFGRAPYDNTADFDLVDLAALIRHNGESGAAQKLLHAVEEAVVYSRSNVDEACGLSVYHPSINREAYQREWAETYSSRFSGFSADYVQYLRRFGQILIGDPLENWAEMVPGALRYGERRDRLSPAADRGQLEHFLSAAA